MLRKMLLVFLGIVTSAFGPGLLYFGLKALKEARELRIPTSSTLSHQVDSAAADVLDLAAQRAVSQEEWTHAHMAANEMRSFSEDNDRTSRWWAGMYDFFGWTLIVAGIVVMIAWWHTYLNSLN
jgi:hypothetical protein